MQLATIDEVVDEVGPLIETVPKFEPGTVWSARQHMNARRTEPDPEIRQLLRNKWYRTNNSSLFELGKNGKAVAYLGDGTLIFGDLAEAVRQLTGETGNYRPGEEAAYAFKRAPDTVRAELDGLRLRNHNDEFSYFTISTLKGREGLNPLQVVVAEKPYGQAEDLEGNMKMLHDSGISETRIWVLNPDYVKQMAAQGPIARASGLGGFVGGSRFGAVGRDVGGAGGGLRGVRRRSAEGAPKIPEVLDEATTAALKTGQAFRYDGQLYVPVSSNAQVRLG